MSLIALHSVPRSGSTWLGQIFNSHPAVVYKYQPLFSYAFKDFLSPSSSRGEILDFFRQIAQRDDDFLDQTAAQANGIVPHFPKQRPAHHTVYKEVRYHHVLANMLKQTPEVKVIGLVRNPWAVLASWKTSPKEFRPEWDFAEQWRTGSAKNQGRPEEFYGFEKWCEVAELFLQFATEFPQQFRLVRYGDLLGDTERMITELFAFCGLEMNPQTREFLVSSRSQNQADTYSVFKQRQQDNDWQTILPGEVVQAVSEHLASSPLQQFAE